MTAAQILEMLHELEYSLDHQMLCTKSQRSKVGCACDDPRTIVVEFIRVFIARQILFSAEET